MDSDAGRHIGKGLAWLGFWLMIGLVNFGHGFDVGNKINSFVEVVVDAIPSKQSLK